MEDASAALTVQFLEWLEGAPRTYADVVETWRTSCPRLSIWEDASADGLVAYSPGKPQTIVLTARGREVLVRSAGNSSSVPNSDGPAAAGERQPPVAADENSSC